MKHQQSQETRDTMFILGNPHGEENPTNFFSIDSSTKYNANTLPRTNDLSLTERYPREQVQTPETLVHETLAKRGCLLLPCTDPELECYDKSE